jgi:eukaryotic-like serine/threonine-protein kinase
MAPEAVAGRYRLEHRLGSGGMSEVWLADDGQLQRKVVVKFLGQGADAARFEREAHAAAALAHPNICQLFDYGSEEGRPFMVLEYLPGGTLEDRLPDGRPLADGETVRILTQLAEGLAHAHERGLIHRDLKPANVLFDAEGRAKIADFGIARVGEASTLTEAGTVLGTAAYISPEQAAGEPATPASGVYALGVIAYRMLTGRLPFESNSPLELARMHLQDEPPSIAKVRPDVPPRLARVTTAALAKDPRERPADGAALLAELQGAEAPTIAETAAETQVMPVPPAGFRRRRLLLAAALIALLAGGAALAVLVTRSPSSSPARVKNPTTPPTHATTAPSTTAPSTTAPTTTRESTTAPTTPVTVPTVPTTSLPVSTILPTTTAATSTTTPGNSGG